VSRLRWQRLSRAVFPEWVEVDTKEAKGYYKARPERSELSSTINESLVIELYSK
jgi:small subunit ribosomal protein S4